ncbi:MAG: hypothetical protein IPG08_10100 [Sphingobacteriaceae bacterium]|nr:hypothetical protein [Sphingobacteriaceae bacterium]
MGYSVLQDRILKAFNSGVGGPPSSSFLTSATMGYAMMLENSTFSKDIFQLGIESISKKLNLTSDITDSEKMTEYRLMVGIEAFRLA